MPFIFMLELINVINYNISILIEEEKGEINGELN
ncbi:hypothetical protein BCM20_005602 [Clostridium beijerinckii]|nr:hypothetical protein [Clostridium beijerinckii]NYC05433.1 hypothetical protein [Clostridium beijerinckii]NYC05506.1 hypothetical protein [Clostridium beijerinckii]